MVNSQFDQVIVLFLNSEVLRYDVYKSSIIVYLTASLARVPSHNASFCLKHPLRRFKNGFRCPLFRNQNIIKVQPRGVGQLTYF